jgi:hypothetical protein
MINANRLAIIGSRDIVDWNVGQQSWVASP